MQKPKSGTVDAALKDLCNTFIGAPLEGDEDECTKVGPIELEGSPAELQRGVGLEKPAAVLWMSYRTSNPDVAAQAEEVLDDVEDAVSETEARSDPHRVPDRLGLQEGRHPVQGRGSEQVLDLGTTDPLEVLGRLDLEVARELGVVHAGEVDAVDVHV